MPIHQESRERLADRYAEIGIHLVGHIAEFVDGRQSLAEHPFVTRRYLSTEPRHFARYTSPNALSVAFAENLTQISLCAAVAIRHKCRPNVIKRGNVEVVRDLHAIDSTCAPSAHPP